MTRWASPVSVFCLLLLLALGWIFFRLADWSSRGGESSPLYSTRRHDPYGAAALRDLLAERGRKVELVASSRMESSRRGILFQILPLEPSGIFEGHDPALPAGNLRDWISAGNTVVQLSRRETELMRSFDLQISGSPLSAVIEAHQEAGKPPDALPGEAVEARVQSPAATPEHPLSAPDLLLVLHAPRRLSRRGGEDLPSLASDKGNVFAAEIRHGAGKFIAIGCPEPALNGWISQGGNLDFLLGLAGGEPVYFDEWSHGLGNAETMIGIISSLGLLPVLFQAIFLVCLYIWSAAGRRSEDAGEPLRLRSSVEQVDALGLLYSRVFSKEETVGRVRQEIRLRMAAALRCSASAIEEKLRALPPAAAAVHGMVLDAVRLMEEQSKGKNFKSALASGMEGLALAAQFTKEKKRVR